MTGTASEPLRLPLGSIGASGLAVNTEVRGEHLAVSPPRSDGAALGVGDVAIAPYAPVVVNLRCSLVNDGVLVAGELATSWCGPCSRCARDIEGTATVSVRERFVAAEPLADPALTEDGEYALEPQHLNLTAMVRDALLLELPTAGARCPYGDGCEHLPTELRPDELKRRQLPPDSDRAAADPDEGPAPRDERWAALDVLRER